eukprot:6034552-Lingulodinium_polyedra.AAC.1
MHGARRIHGREWVLQSGSHVFPGVLLRWIPGQKLKDPEMSCLAGRLDIRPRCVLVNIPWFT